MVSIRKAGLPDIDELTELRVAYLNEDHGGLSAETERTLRTQLPGYYQRHLNQDLFVYLLIVEESVAACAFLLVDEKPMSPAFINGRTGTVLNVYTRADMRHRGYGGRVMEELLKDAEKMEIAVIELKATQAGYPLYQKAGFADDQSVYHRMVWHNSRVR